MAYLQTDKNVVTSGIDERSKAIENFKQAVFVHQTEQNKLKNLNEKIKQAKVEFKLYDKHMKAILTGSQLIGEILRKLDYDKYIVKTLNGPRYVVGIKTSLCNEPLDQGTRVTLDSMTYSVVRILPREVDPLVYAMTIEDPGSVSFEDIGGLYEQIRSVREVIELPLNNPHLFLRVGIKPPKGCLLFGPPGTGKTLLARAIAKELNCSFIKVVASSIVDKYIGESARLIREMFVYAKDHQPCIIFMDEIDAIGGKRFSEGSSADREIQRTLMELLNQMDGFDEMGKVKIIMATNRPDTLDPALLRPGRIDRKIHIDLPSEVARLEIFKIYIRKMNIKGKLDLQLMVKMSNGFNGADIKTVATEAGLCAIRDDRDYAIQEDFMKSLRKVDKSKKLETTLDYSPV